MNTMLAGSSQIESKSSESQLGVYMIGKKYFSYVFIVHVHIWMPLKTEHSSVSTTPKMKITFKRTILGCKLHHHEKNEESTRPNLHVQDH